MREWRNLQGGEVVDDAADTGMTPGKQTLTMGMHSVQRRAASDDADLGDGEAHEIASAGTAGSGGSLPHLDTIQRSFGHHDVTGVSAHTDHAAGEAAHALGAEAYAFGNHVAFGGAASLHTAAHEAAHVVQQRSGAVGAAVGREGDEHERHADAVADRVVAGKSAESLLDGVAGGRAAGAAVQHKVLSGTLAQRYVQKRAVQRSSAGGVSVSNVTFAPKEIPDDGATTAQASATYSAKKMSGPATLNWAFDGNAFGATVNASGLVTPGTDTVPIDKEKVVLKVTASDSAPAKATATGNLTLLNRKVIQAKKDFATFTGATYKQLNYHQGINGNFDAVYNPKGKNLDISVRVKLVFADDQPKAAKWNAATKAAYQQKYLSMVKNAWSKQYQFENVAEPKLVWKKLNAVNVTVGAKIDNAAPHFTITVHKQPTRANVLSPNADFDSTSVTANKNPFPNTGPAELAALQGKIPTPLQFAAGTADIAGADQPKVAFLGSYLHQVHSPKFKLTVTGHAALDPAATTPKQKAAAAATARTLSAKRANAVKTAIRATANTQHSIAVVAKGDTASIAAPLGDKVEITAAVDPSYVNTQPVAAHEFGHMLGLGDEYTSGTRNVGDQTTHYGLAKDALGQDSADSFAKVTADSENLMNGGNDVRPVEYVTLWAALGDAAATAAAPAPPFARADWKFVGM
jgi:outer membrane protein OmpA-like peptidoglycan-associated protein